MASSNACTYTFSSGIGPGKKRRRKIGSPGFNAALSQHRPVSRPNSSSRERESSSGSRNEWNFSLDASDGAVVTPAEVIRHATNIHNGHNTLPTSDRDCSDVFLSGPGFVFCPGKHVSPVTRLASPPQSSIESTLRVDHTPSLDPEMLQIFDEPSLRIRDPPSTSALHQDLLSPSTFQTEPLDFMPQSTSASPPSNLTVIQSDDANTAYREASGPSRRCECVASITQMLQELETQGSFDTKNAATDMIFESVEQGIDQFSDTNTCDGCSINDVSPVLVITPINQLALMLSELVHRLTHCRTPETVPTLFQFGTYSVQKTKMRTSLLTGMIELHVRSLDQLINRLETCMAEQPRTLLAGAASIVASMQQTLKVFPEGSPS